jgi:uncharacterized protein
MMKRLPDDRTFLYLHGFASSPASRKARFLTDRFGQIGRRLLVPDLAEGNFEKLTIHGQLNVIDRAVGGAPAVLVGSSLGGYLAALYAARHANVEALILLAPAFGFAEIWPAELGPERMAKWRETGQLPVFHYAELRSLPLHFEFLEDARRHEPFPSAAQPALVIHGTRDSVVPLAQSELWVRNHPAARLLPLPSDHELGDVLDIIWNESHSFLDGLGLL